MKIGVPIIICIIIAFLLFFLFPRRKVPYEKICLEGHIYFYTTGFNEGGIAPKLNDDGTPCDCQSEKSGKKNEK